MEIKSISQKIFRTSPSKVENNGSHTNPFGVNFKGNMISADVFESSEKQNAAQNVAFKGAEMAVKAMNKIKASAFVGSLGDMASAVSARFNSVVDFGRRIKQKAGDICKYLNETKLTINIGLAENKTKDLFRMDFWSPEYSVGALKKRSVSDLEAMFEEAIAARA